MKEFNISGVVATPASETQDTVTDKFIEWVESQGWTFGGAVTEETTEEEP